MPRPHLSAPRRLQKGPPQGFPCLRGCLLPLVALAGAADWDDEDADRSGERAEGGMTAKMRGELRSLGNHLKKSQL